MYHLKQKVQFSVLCLEPKTIKNMDGQDKY